jgi:putative Flp pilus-assembly TadE/G-like protein
MRSSNLYRSERGAIFIQVGVLILAVMAINVFVVDYGVMWTARGQAQNAADAAALSGALARAYEDFGTPPSSTGAAARSARVVAASNPVWQQAPITDVSWTCPGGGPGRCVHVDVFRDSAHGNAVETFFGPIIGITGQDVRATATARVQPANATDCLRPTAFADDWQENTGNDQFNKYGAGGVPLAGAQDVYIRPTDTVAGERRVGIDLGERIVWQLDQPTTTTAPITRELVVVVRLPNGMDAFNRIKHCSGDMVQIGQTLPVEIPYAGFVNNGLNYLMGLDPGVTWNEGQHRIETSCAPGCGNMTPRLIAVPLYDPDLFQKGRSSGNWVSVGCPSNSPCITVTNITGFFVHGAEGAYGPHGHFLPYPGLFLPAGPTPLTEDAAWLVTAHLVR